MINTLFWMRTGGLVQRFHTGPLIKPENVAEHSFGVACLCYVLSKGSPSVDLLMAALAHDLPEQETGDLPAPTKRLIGSPLKDKEKQLLEHYGLNFHLTANEVRTLKLADIFDGMLKCIAEMRLGNREVSSIYVNYQSYAKELKPAGIELEVLQVIDRRRLYDC